tara:strand:+ start:358 stop:636 length:279 start_codon:yes stop_codon:yes gene_type:complete
VKIYITATIAIVIDFDKQNDTEPTQPTKATPAASQAKLTRYDGNFVGSRPSKPREANFDVRSDKGTPHFSSCCGAQGRRALKTLGGKCKDCV